MKATLAFAALAGSASAFPALLESFMTGRDLSLDEINQLAPRAAPDLTEKSFTCPSVKLGPAAAVAASKARTNCGPTPCLLFDAKAQYVSTTGDHKYVAPKAGDIRGPCPGLNAVANHGYFPHSGLVNNQQTIDGLSQAYGFGNDMAAGLAVLSIEGFGDPVAQLWSIGGPVPTPPGSTPPNTLVNTGISYSHNNYEGDASIARGDAYLHNGDAHSLVLSRFKEVYANRLVAGRGAVPGTGFGYTLDSFDLDYHCKSAQSIAQNPEYVSAPIGGLVVAPGAFHFVINFMSNHSAANPSGWLSPEVFKTFFGISGTYPNFKWNPGQERIPDNWYRRPLANPYGLEGLFGDLAITYSAYPETARLGCNNGKVNTYVQGDPTPIISLFAAGSLSAVLDASKQAGLLPPNCPGVAYQPRGTDQTY